MCIMTPSKCLTSAESYELNVMSDKKFEKVDKFCGHLPYFCRPGHISRYHDQHMYVSWPVS